MAMSKKKLLIIAVVALVAIVAIAAAAAGGNKNATNDDNNSNINNDNNNSNTNTREQIANVTLTGTSDKVTDKFNLQAGVTIFHLTYGGAGNFAVTLKDADGGYVDLLANEIGAYSGETLIGVKTGNIVGAETGEHFLDIQASGPWNVTIEQPRVSSGAALPQTLSGSGPEASIPITLTSGVAVFNMTHTGTSNFAVTLWADDGDYVDLLANEIGDYSGEKSVTVNGGILNASPGIHWLKIDADGPWTIKITKM